MPYIYTVRFGLVDVPADVATTVFTALPGYAWIIRDVFVYQGPTPNAVFYLNLVAGSRTATLMRIGSSVEQVTHLELRQRMEVGDQLIAISQTGGARIVVTGYQLEL